MTLQRKRSSGVTESLKSAFFVFAALLFLTGMSPRESAAPQKPSPKASETYVQQIGPAGEEAPMDIGKIYDSVPSNKPLRASSQFKVVDDFNRGELKNAVGGAWSIEKDQEKKVRTDLKKEDARGARSGASLWARFNLRKKDKTAFRTSLERLDMSAAHYLVFKCKIQAPRPFKGNVRIALSDWAGKTAEKDVTDACLEGEKWNEVVLPMSVFMGVDLDQLGFLSFKVSARDANLAGKLGLDEIAFFGHPEVGFESVEDNFVGFPQAVLNEPRRKELLATREDNELLLKVAQDTWRYFEAATDKRTRLVSDHFKVGDFPLAAAYTSPTNIALDLMGTVAARELGIITPEQASGRVQSLLKTLKKLKTWKGFFFNFYETTRLGVTRQFVSSVDSGWLAVALVVVRQAFGGEIAADATALLDGFHFQEFLDPETNQLRVGYDVEQDRPTPYHYGMLATEARVASLYGIGKGDLPEEHWWYLYRTAPEEWDWQTQEPHGKMARQGAVSYFQGYYKEGNKKFVPSWGGSLFEFLMPTLVIREQKYASKNLGANDRIVTELQRDFALKEKKYPVWGISPASTSDGRRWMYGEYGVKRLGVKGYPDRGVITPHASFLALDALPKDAIKNIRKLLTFPIYGEYGFYDSISFPSERINTQYLVLDQGMVLIPIANYLKKGVIQGYFHKDPIGKKIEELLGKEEFFKN
jgi:hypothetical protein